MGKAKPRGRRDRTPECGSLGCFPHKKVPRPHEGATILGGPSVLQFGPLPLDLSSITIAPWRRYSLPGGVDAWSKQGIPRRRSGGLPPAGSPGPTGRWHERRKIAHSISREWDTASTVVAKTCGQLAET